jgi:[acyl-carrier-protein] S-malonyltransferase
LVGLVKRALPGVETFALKSPDDLTAAREFVTAHAMASPLDTSPTWRLLVSPLSGTFRRGDAEAGEALVEGSAVGGVVARGEDHPVLAPHGGTVIEWLAEDGDPVSPGQPLVRLHPDGAE